MEKTRHGLPCPASRLTLKYILMTKLAIILIIGFTIPAAASSYGQGNITLRLDNATMKEALKAIEDQGTYRFVYKTSVLSREQRVTVKAENAPLEEVMKAML